MQLLLQVVKDLVPRCSRKASRGGKMSLLTLTLLSWCHQREPEHCSQNLMSRASRGAAEHSLTKIQEVEKCSPPQRPFTHTEKPPEELKNQWYFTKDSPTTAKFLHHSDLSSSSGKYFSGIKAQNSL